MKIGMDLKSVKQRNKSVILYFLNELGDVSRKELAIRTGLTPSAVTKLTAELIEDGYVKENGTLDAMSTGRRATLLTLRLEDKNILGVNAERDAVTFSLCDLSGKLLDKEKIRFDNDLDRVVDLGKKFLKRTGQKIVATGVCVGADLDISKDEAREKFERAFGVEAYVENGVRAFAEADFLFGDTNNDLSTLFFKWGPDVGSAFISDGWVFDGSEGSDIGRYVVRPHEGQGALRKTDGCLFDEAAADAIVDAAKAKGLTISADAIELSRDKRLDDVIDEKLKSVASALLNAATLFNADDVVLFGSVFARAGVEAKLNALLMSYRAGINRVKTSALNDKRDYIGAVALCVARLLFKSK